MLITNPEELVNIIKDNRNKVISRFATTGKLHKGHIEALEMIKSKSDVVIVAFNDWYPQACLRLGCSSVPSWKKHRDLDISILASKHLADYVVSRDLTEDIFSKIVEFRKMILDHTNLAKDLGIIQKDYIPNDLLARMSCGLYVTEEEPYCTYNWYGNKDMLVWLLPYLIGQKYGIPLRYDFYPIIRDENGVPYESSTTQDIYDEKLRLRDSYLNIKNNLLSDGELKVGTDLKGIVSLINLKEFKKEIKLKSGSQYVLLTSVKRANSDLNISYSDCEFIDG